MRVMQRWHGYYDQRTRWTRFSVKKWFSVFPTLRSREGSSRGCYGHTSNGLSGLYKANNCTIVLIVLDLASSVYSTPGPQILKGMAKY